mmetsp:Transcript_31963/g.41085  ORF Transcript_31963/g.41085 Transcript_31963/m.41085 type:complete len:554 (+) Transcript_31963:104-1765(+)|eukprot:CAMPEP_0114363050 /NCGR_PEP_ID=MMETSP0101-20121206/26217_1 /TAXON_ID=38822 ORGANISM="Pteridomonas danica, Strain PT" /NCGR_SAMPLE_ID=MMETSP0101 /ASSEMBLY_ACC=CAM_ASM_000211 /LENGTH=553 /DNA_ID=CAMNT_0001509381 /DNA_START=54 /DNA_END=1715 /DNA_ORIENTATION=+
MNKFIRQNNVQLFRRNFQTKSVPFIHNSLSGALQELQVKPPYVTWYACGPTVYDDAHLGHARTYVCFDIIRRILTSHYKIPLLYAMGVTDIDDKIINKAKEENVLSSQIAKKFEKRFFEDMFSLGVLEPHVRLRVSEHMTHIIKYIEEIINQGHAYSTPSGVYFDVKNFGDKNYGSFKHPSSEDDDDGILLNSDKRDRRDFALWKCSSNAEDLNNSGTSGSNSDSSWESPWGVGRPGWHIECSALTHSHFGSKLNIHSGGRDLAFPHHCNEIAQCESHAGSPGKGWGDLWIHTGHLYIKGRKMSKSLKNFISIKELLNDRGVHKDDIRLFCLQYHYRSDIHFSEDRMSEAQSLRSNILKFLERAQTLGTCTGPWDIEDRNLFERVMKAQQDVDVSLSNDFDTPNILRILSSLITTSDIYMKNKEVSGMIPKQPLEAVSQLVISTFQMLGVDSITSLSHRVTNNSDSELVSNRALEELVLFRSQVRDLAKTSLKKDKSTPQGEKAVVPLGVQVLKLCDQLRDDTLPTIGVYVEDRVSGSFTSSVAPTKKPPKSK